MELTESQKKLVLETILSGQKRTEVWNIYKRNCEERNISRPSVEDFDYIQNFLLPTQSFNTWPVAEAYGRQQAFKEVGNRFRQFAEGNYSTMLMAELLGMSLIDFHDLCRGIAKLWSKQGKLPKEK